MRIFKRIGEMALLQTVLGKALAGYLKLVKATTRFTLDPPDLYERLDRAWPAILAMWHGQHFMVPLGKLPKHRFLTLISRHRDGAINAVAAAAFDIGAIRGSGGPPSKMHQKRGPTAFREMLRALANNSTMVLTADIPKTARVAGEGIVMLAALSGRPILPVTVVTRRRIDFASWDKASIGLPFGRGVIALGEPIIVPRDADEELRERLRLELESALDALHARAYGLVGGLDPGRELGPRNRAVAKEQQGLVP